jgi:hypothetical protein
LRHRMSDLPLPLKSPVPAICQAAGTFPRFSYVNPPDPLEGAVREVVGIGWRSLRVCEPN